MPLNTHTLEAVDISVLIPVYNREDLLTLCLRSVLDQKTDATFEIVVVDDASTDGSAIISERMGATVIRSPYNVGCGAARRLGLGALRGAWTAFLDSDDIWLPHHLDTLWAHRAGVGLVATSALASTSNRVLGNPFPWKRHIIQPSQLLGPENLVVLSGAMVRTDILRATGFSTRHYADDLEAWASVLSQCIGVILPTLTVGYRTHAGQVSSDSAMSVETRQTVVDLVDSGLFTSNALSLIDLTLLWDAAGSRRWLQIPIQLRRDHAGLRRLMLLLLTRWCQRHRWRMHPITARRLLQRLDDRVIMPN